MSNPELVINDDHKRFLSTILDGTDDAAVLAAASQAAHTWGLSPDVEDPTEEQWSAAETDTLTIIEAIVEGLADGTVTVRAPKTVAPAQDDDTFNLLAALGVAV